MLAPLLTPYISRLYNLTTLMCHHRVIIKCLHLLYLFLNVFEEIYFLIWLKALCSSLQSLFPFLEITIPLNLNNIVALQNFPHHSSDEYGNTEKRRLVLRFSHTFIILPALKAFRYGQKFVCLKNSAFPNLPPKLLT